MGLVQACIDIEGYQETCTRAVPLPASTLFVIEGTLRDDSDEADDEWPTNCGWLGQIMPLLRSDLVLKATASGRLCCHWSFSGRISSSAGSQSSSGTQLAITGIKASRARWLFAAIYEQYLSRPDLSSSLVDNMLTTG